VREVIRELALGRSRTGRTVVSLLALTGPVVVTTVAGWALREVWRPGAPMPEERPVVDDPIVHIPKAGLVAWVTVRHDEEVVPLVEALHRGGVTAVALQASTLALPQAVGRARTAFERRVLIGVTGVHSAAEAREVARAGAEFLLTASVDPEVIRVCQEARVVTIPGAFTPTEIRQAWAQRTGLVALFPAGGLGPAYVRDVLRAMPDITLVAAGAITPEHAGEFIRAGAAAVVASDESEVGESRDSDVVTRRARAFVEAIDHARTRPVRPAPPVRPVEGPDIR